MFRTARSFSSFAVDDVDAARRFYGETLGLDVRDTSGMGMLELRLEGGGEVVIYPKPDHQPATFTVLNFAVEDIIAAVDALRAAGIELERYDLPGLEPDERGIHRGMGPPIAWFTDPAGNILSVLESSDG